MGDGGAVICSHVLSANAPGRLRPTLGRWAGACALLVLAVAWLWFRGLQRSVGDLHDFRMLYAVGRSWLNGVNPYQCVVTFENGEGPDSLLDGFTVTGGKGRNVFIYDYVGGGICCLDASPTIQNNIVRNNSVQVIHGGWASGGGIYCNEAAVIENNVIHNNGAGGYGSGGGIACYGSCLVRENILRE
jgi:hypothetical protein